MRRDGLLATVIAIRRVMRYTFSMSRRRTATDAPLSALERRERRARISQKLSELYHEDTVAIRLHSGEDLYNHYDPAPEQQRELSPDVEAYILRELEYKSAKARIAVTFIADDVSLYDIELMRAAFANHFRRRAGEQLIRNRTSINRWLGKLAVAVLVLALLLAAAHFFSTRAAEHPVYSVLSEGVGIIGWVALWEPATYFLYGRGEERRRLFDFLRLRHATVTIVHTR